MQASEIELQDAIIRQGLFLEEEILDMNCDTCAKAKLADLQNHLQLNFDRSKLTKCCSDLSVATICILRDLFLPL